MSLKSHQLIVNKVKNRIYGHGRGWCFSKNNFLDLGNDETIKKSLARLAEDGTIRRISEGLYEYPRKHRQLGLLPPQIDQVVQALEQKYQIRTQPSGAYAANIVGLSEQVPAKAVFLTDGASRKLKIGKQEILLKSTTTKNMTLAGQPMGLLFQAMKYIGKEHLKDAVIRRKIKAFLKKVDRRAFKNSLTSIPEWGRRYLQQMEVMS